MGILAQHKEKNKSSISMQMDIRRNKILNLCFVLAPCYILFLLVITIMSPENPYNPTWIQLRTIMPSVMALGRFITANNLKGS